MSRTLLCADGNHEECVGRVTAGFPEQGSPTAPCTCSCHTYYVASGDGAVTVSGRGEAMRLTSSIHAKAGDE